MMVLEVPKRPNIGIKVLSLVFIFLLRLRFPTTKSIPEILRQRYGIGTLRLWRKAEQFDKKLQKAKLDLEFLKHCRDHGLIPHFLQFKTASSHL